MEEEARSEYVTYQQNHGHPCLQVEHVGLVVSLETPWIAASPDDRVTDPSATPPLGLAEYKNPYSARKMSLSEACKSKTFCLQKDGEPIYSLKRYYIFKFSVNYIVRTESGVTLSYALRKSYMLKGYQETKVGGRINSPSSMHSILRLSCQS